MQIEQPIRRTAFARLSAWIADELRWDAFLRSILAGLLIYLLEIIIVVSFGALIFSGDLARQLPFALGMVILGDAILCAVTALFSSYPGSIGVEQDVPSAILAVAAAAVIAALPAGTNAAQQFATVVVMLAGTSMVTGLFFLLLGGLKLGGLVRFLPYPVMGGFLAGTGWLLATGAVGVMGANGLGPDLLQPGALLHWLPGAMLGAVMFWAVGRFKGPLVLPLAFIGAIAVFYLVVVLLGIPLARLGSEGWLLGPFPAGSLWQFPFSSEIVSQVNWGALVSQIPALAPAALISVIALLLNVSGLELVVKQDLDPNRELMTAGLGNLAGGLSAGLVGYHAISLSTLNHAMSGRKRLPGLVTALLIGLTVLLGESLLNNVPKMVLGALLFFLGLALLWEWVYQAWFKFPKIDFLIILLILGIIAARGFLEGIVAGIVLTILIFVVNYSRISIVKYSFSGTTYRSRVMRTRGQRAVLDAHGEQIYACRLQGYIFFGTANNLLSDLKTHLARVPGVRFVALDFAEVSGLDSTALLSFFKLLQLLEERQVRLVLTALKPVVRGQFEKGGLRERCERICFFPDLDHGIEWCEEQILAATPQAPEVERGIQEQLEEILPGNPVVARLVGYMHRSEIGAGEYLMRQGEDPDRVLFVESGQVTAQLETPGKAPTRLQTMRGGYSVGELGFYLGLKRTASVIADMPSVVYGMSRSDLDRLERDDPEAASALHQIIVQVLGQRVAHLTRVVDALER